MPTPYSSGAGRNDAQGSRYVAQEGVWNLKQDPGAVSGVLFAAAGAAMGKVFQNLNRVANDPIRLPSFHVHDQPDAARIAFLTRVVKSLRLGR
jgi:hypothetical protein